MDGLEVCTVRTLVEALEALNQPEAATLVHVAAVSERADDGTDLADIRGQAVARRAIGGGGGRRAQPPDDGSPGRRQDDAGPTHSQPSCRK